jgi:hypothetical protein
VNVSILAVPDGRSEAVAGIHSQHFHSHDYAATVHALDPEMLEWAEWLARGAQEALKRDRRS